MLIEVNNLSKLYRTKLSLVKSESGNKRAVNNVSFTIDNNEIIGLVGESGCGKSTLSRLIMRIEKPTVGNVSYRGRDIWSFKGDDLNKFRKSCQIIFQDTLTSLNPNMKIVDTLKEPLNNHFKMSEEEKIKKIQDIIFFANLNKGILANYPANLSGGERQRVNICRALLLEPEFLICDEIISSLDVYTQAVVLNMIKRLISHNNMGVLFVSHDISAVKYLCSKIMVMYKGEIVEVIDNKNKEYKISHPYTKKLVSSVPINNPNKRLAMG
ncbi:ABC transporter ATP-binding protein [Clostridium magnum]|uniref:Oligopeptide transport ATP-binding protein OppF n=1 Tax=Clostridium magnum DSM 2767 TaxID=1121326 RepID=A0A162SZ25_9CLOT|nr:ABC transporter ATP-binding protein [Clostridium magnum]KZL92049.1 oligopeptide transport ATP-binding protein OppF [Clostridium magnum DSM 2767]SHH24529.1 ABC transporter [Clostridium magnum DSM 2767]